ncbi:MAG: ATP-binding protein, partial [Myxococcota bacterium]
EQIEDLFFTTKASGTGLGLPIAQKVINAHGGSMTVESASPLGTRFRILLPRPFSAPQEV